MMKQTTQSQRYKQLHNNLITESHTQDARCKMVQLSQDSNNYWVLHFGNFFPLGQNSCELGGITVNKIKKWKKIKFFKYEEYGMFSMQHLSLIPNMDFLTHKNK